MDAYALLIGVDDYRAYDPTGGSDLHGAVNDVRGWWHAAQALGLPPENIRVLTTADLQTKLGDAGKGAAFGRSTREAIVEGLGWIRDRLRGPNHAKALVTFSGHGAWDPTDGSVLCPADTGPQLANALPASEMYRILDQRPQLDHHRNPVTLFIDACDATGGQAPQGGKVRGLPSPKGSRAGGHTFFGKLHTDLLMAASKPGTASYEIPTETGWRGAFSYAALAILRRWSVDAAEGDRFFDLTYADLAGRISDFCKAMAVPQTAHFDSNQGRRKIFTMEPGTLLGAPDAPKALPGRELTPGTMGKVAVYALTGEDSLVGHLYAPADDLTPSNGLKRGNWYWVPPTPTGSDPALSLKDFLTRTAAGTVTLICTDEGADASGLDTSNAVEYPSNAPVTTPATYFPGSNACAIAQVVGHLSFGTGEKTKWFASTSGTTPLIPRDTATVMLLTHTGPAASNEVLYGPTDEAPT